MKKAISRGVVFLLCCILFTAMPVTSIASVITDSTQVEWREFDESKIEKLRNDPDYRYEREKTKANDFWEEVRNWLSQFDPFRWLDRKMDAETGNSVANLVIGTIALFAVGMLIWALTKANFTGFITGKGKKVQLDYEVMEEDIHGIAYESELQKAEREKDFRKAIRLRYLETLKALTDKNWIEWTPNKTNHEYYAELKGVPYLDAFRKLTFIFDYVWYGEFEIDESMYAPFAGDFSSFVQLVNQRPARPFQPERTMTT